MLGNKMYTFQVKHRFHKKLSQEFLLVDLLNNLESLAEDTGLILKNVPGKLSTMNLRKFKRDLREYGSLRTKAFFNPLIEKMEPAHGGRLPS